MQFIYNAENREYIKQKPTTTITPRYDLESPFERKISWKVRFIYFLFLQMELVQIQRSDSVRPGSNSSKQIDSYYSFKWSLLYTWGRLFTSSPNDCSYLLLFIYIDFISSPNPDD